MTKLTVTAKGQVTLKKDVLQHLGVGPGEQITIEKLPGGRVEVRGAPSGDISQIFGILKREGQPEISIEEMNKVIADAWAGKR